MEKGLAAHGIRNVKAVHSELPTSALYEQIVSSGEGLIAHLGPIVAMRTGVYTGPVAPGQVYCQGAFQRPSHLLGSGGQPRR